MRRYPTFMQGLAGILVAVALVLTGCGREDRLWRISPFEEEASSERVNLWPLAYHSGNATSILWPLFDVDDRGFALRPLIAKDGSAYSLLFPYASFDTREREGWITPFYRVQDNAGLFPLANFGRLSWVGPVWWDSTGEGHGLFPLYGIDLFGHGIDHVGPLWWGRDEEQPARWGFAPLLAYADAGRRFSLLPFYSQQLTDDARSRNVLLGLGHWHADARGRERWLLPLHYDRSEADERDSVLLPFFWKHRRGESADVYTLLGNRSVDPGSSSLNLYPLWWSNESAQSRWRMLIPLFYVARDGDERTFLTPLGGRGWSESGERAFVNVLGPLYHHSASTRRDEERTAFLWPLFESRREGETSETRMAWLYSRKASPGATESIYLLGLAHAQETETGSSHRFWPLYSWSDEAQRPGVFYDLTLFGRAAHGDASRTWLFPFFACSSSGAADPADSAERSTLVGWSEWKGGRSFQLGAEWLYRSQQTEGPTGRSQHASALFSLFTHDKQELLAVPVPVPEPRSDVNRVRHETRGFLFEAFLSESATYRVWNDGVAIPDEASEGFAAENTHTSEYRKLRVPLLFDYERDAEHSRSSFLYYGYRGETRGGHTRRDIFPFITWDSGPAEKDISFLWRFLHYERKGDRRGGHLLFIRWGDI